MRESIVAPRVWQVGALCSAIADALQARFNPLRVTGEITGFSRPASGHCYFSLKDGVGQIRCAMFRRVASMVDFALRDGDQVEVLGRIGVYEPRGELQIIVEGIKRAGQGTLFEQFLQLKEKLQNEGLFEASRKRALPILPRAIGVVTSLGAAALYDVAHALRRRVPHLPIIISPSSVQGEGAPAELVAALERLYRICNESSAPMPAIDVILLVRGGGSMEDLWAFNNEHLARAIAMSPVPVVCGVGHETDFSIADFVADLRAPTPTAAAELVCEPVSVWFSVLDGFASRIQDAANRYLDRQAQRLDRATGRIGRPLALTSQHRAHLAVLERRMQHALRMQLQGQRTRLERLQHNIPQAFGHVLQRMGHDTQQAGVRLKLLDPTLVLQRGYAWLQDAQGNTISKIVQAQPGFSVRATLADGTVDMLVTGQG